MTGTNFIGRRPASCGQCRRRRVKCGRQRPGCVQCREKSITCPGYGPAFSLDFKDESRSTALKVQSRMLEQVQVGKQLTTPVLDAAFHFLASQYLCSMWMRLHDLYKSMPSGSALAVAVYAPALAAFALDSGQPCIMTMARAQYTRALQRTNRALRDPRERLTDDTLASVVHLAMFEAIAFNERTTPTIWTTHLHGALELLRQRGRRQLDAPVGRDLYWGVMQCLRVSCAQQRVPVPDKLCQMEAQAADRFAQFHPAHRLTSSTLLDELANLRARRIAVFPAGAVVDTLRLDRAIVAFRRHLATTQAFVATFPLLSVAKMWNTLRMLRLYMHSWVFHDLVRKVDVLGLALSEEETRQRTTSFDVAQHMASAILASVPLFVTPRPTAASRSLILPLCSVGKQAMITEVSRAEAKKMLQFIGTEGRLPQALRAVEMLEQPGGVLEDWCHLSYLN